METTDTMETTGKQTSAAITTRGKWKKVVSSDTIRPIMGNVLVSPSDGESAVFLTATDGHILAVRRVTGNVTEGRYLIPGAAFAREDTLILKGSPDEADTRTEGMKSGKFHLSDSSDAVTFPDCTGIMRPEIEKTFGPGARTIKIALDADILLKLSEAICVAKEHKVVLSIPLAPEKDGEAPIAVEGAILVAPTLAAGESFGLIMPVRIPQDPMLGCNTLADEWGRNFSGTC